MLAIVAVLGYRHIELSAKVLGVALALEIGIVVVLDVAMVAKPGPAGVTFASFDPDVFTQGTIGIAILFALTGFIGFEATAVFRDEARDPERTIPRATYAAVIIIGAFYAITVWAFVVAIGPDQVTAVAQQTLAGEGNMLLDTTGDMLGSVGRDIVNVLLLTSLFACVLSFHNVIARYQFVLAGKGLLPARLAKVHDDHDAPSFSSVVQTVTAAVIVAVLAILGIDPLVGVFGSMAGIATVGMVCSCSPRRSPSWSSSCATATARRPAVDHADRPGAGRPRPARQPVAGAVELHLGHRRQRDTEHRPGRDPLCRARHRLPGLASLPVAVIDCGQLIRRQWSAVRRCAAGRVEAQYREQHCSAAAADQRVHRDPAACELEHRRERVHCVDRRADSSQRGHLLTLGSQQSGGQGELTGTEQPGDPVTGHLRVDSEDPSGQPRRRQRHDADPES